MIRVNQAFTEALKRPTAKGGRGWKYADNDSMLASACDMWGGTLCLNGIAVYKWARRYERRFWIKCTANDIKEGLMIAVFNDCTIAKALEMLREAH